LIPITRPDWTKLASWTQKCQQIHIPDIVRWSSVPTL